MLCQPMRNQSVLVLCTPAMVCDARLTAEPKRHQFLLMQKLYEHDKILPGDVEGADDWMRATVPEHERLRRRPRSGGNQTAESSAASRSMV